MLSRNFYFTPTPRIAMYSETSAPIGAWEVNLEIMTDKPTDQPPNRPTDGLIGKFHFQKDKSVWFSSIG